MRIFKVTVTTHAFGVSSVGTAIKDISGDLHSLQEEVGGLICPAPYFPELEEKGIDIYVDDEGILKEYPISIVRIKKDDSGAIEHALFGNAIFLSHDDDGYSIGLSDEQLKFVQDHLRIAIVGSQNGSPYNYVATFDF
jgi:hypothetical protein